MKMKLKKGKEILPLIIVAVAALGLLVGVVVWNNQSTLLQGSLTRVLEYKLVSAKATSSKNVMACFNMTLLGSALTNAVIPGNYTINIPNIRGGILPITAVSLSQADNKCINISTGSQVANTNYTLVQTVLLGSTEQKIGGVASVYFTGYYSPYIRVQ